MKLKRDTMVQLNITAGAALKLYCIVGKSNGGYISTGAFDELKRVLNDEDREFHDKHIRPIAREDVLNYVDYEDGMEKAFFDRKSQDEIDLESIENRLVELERAAKVLRETIQENNK